MKPKAKEKEDSTLKFLCELFCAVVEGILSVVPMIVWMIHEGFECLEEKLGLDEEEEDEN